MTKSNKDSRHSSTRKEESSKNSPGEMQAEINRLKEKLSLLQREKFFQNTDEIGKILYKIPAVSFVIIDLKGKILSLNEAAAKRFRKSPKEMIGLESKNLFPKKVWEHRKRYIKKAVTTGELQRFVDERSGIWNDIVLYPLKDDIGEIKKIAILVRDITEERINQYQSHINQERLIQAEKMITLGNLISGIAHEINNPTNFITLNVPVLKETWENIFPIFEEKYQNEGDFLIGRFKYSMLREHIDSLLKGIKEGADRIRHIVSALRDYAREDNTTWESNLDINKIITGAIDLLKNLAISRTANFKVRHSNNLPFIKGSSQKIEQVIINLLTNSCESQKTNKDTPIIIQSSFDGQMIIVKVVDKGCGIPQDKLKLITDPFYTSKRDEGGTGLGLAISQTIAKHHGGSLEFESQEGKGTTATLKLPAKNKET